MRRVPLLLVACLAGSCAHLNRHETATGDHRLDAIDPASCDIRRFRARALELAATPEIKAAIERWAPPSPVSLEDRPAIEAVARAYITACGLNETVSLAKDLVAFPTVSAEAKPADHPAFAAMAAYLERWAKENQLAFSVYGAHDVWEISLGEGPAVLGFLMHGDVVPVHEAPATEATQSSSAAVTLTQSNDHPSDWSRPPFVAEVADGKLYGRGTEDDKGPIAAALVVLRTLKAAGLLPGGRIKVIVGTEEEHDWSAMRRFAEASIRSGEAPRFMVSVDASFPVVVGESGFVAWSLAIPRTTGDGSVPSSVAPKIIDARAGKFLTQVPGDASMLVIPRAGEAQESLRQRLQMIAGEVTTALGSKFRVEVRGTKEGVLVRTFGEAVHTSVALEGHNALWPLSEIAHRLNPAPTPIAQLLQVIAERFSRDHFGKKLGLAESHPVMGPLLVVPAVLRTADERVELDVNMRRPAGTSSTAFGAALDLAVEGIRAQLAPALEQRDRHIGAPVLVDTRGPLVPTLLSIYEHQMGERATPVTIRGGTYARLFPGAVSFGPSLPNRPYRGHAPDEYIELEALDLTVRLLLATALELAGPTAAAGSER